MVACVLGVAGPYQAGAYVDFLMEEGEERVRQAYGAARYEGLGAIKRAYDPQNLFRLNQNVMPAPGGPVS